MAGPNIARRPAPAPSLNVNAQEPRDLLENKLAQLRSLTWLCYGGGIDWLDGAGPQHLDNVLWLVADLAVETEELHQRSEAARHAGR